MDDSISIIKQALAWRSLGHRVAFATVIETWGSAPRRAGSIMCINSNAEFQGSVSGGCVETAVIDQALNLIESKESKTIEFGVSDEQAWGVGLACGGKIKIYLAPITDFMLQKLEYLLSKVANKESVLLLTVLGRNDQYYVFNSDEIKNIQVLDSSQKELAFRALRLDRAIITQSQTAQVFIQPFNQDLSLYVIGAVHITQQLVPIVNMLGFRVSIIDPRAAFATESRFQGIELIRQWPDKAFQKLNLNHRTAIITLSHDPKFDDPALISALNSDAFYIGALGSRKTHAGRIDRFKELGFEEHQLSRIFAPIGLDIKASNPSEIAISIAAQLVQQLRKDG